MLRHHHSHVTNTIPEVSASPSNPEARSSPTQPQSLLKESVYLGRCDVGPRFQIHCRERFRSRYPSCDSYLVGLSTSMTGTCTQTAFSDGTSTRAAYSNTTGSYSDANILILPVAHTLCIAIYSLCHYKFAIQACRTFRRNWSLV